MNTQTDYLRFRDSEAGPEYAFYYQVGKTTVTVAICLSLGGLMPILYPVALVYCIVQYIVDRMALAYFYRLPPRYGTHLEEIAATMITYCIPISFGLMLWQYTNKQMFGNRIDRMEAENEVILSHHFIKDILQWEGLKVGNKVLLSLIFVSLIALPIAAIY